MSTETICPAGYDCQGISTCPSKIVSCPDGFFCSSYMGNQYQSDLDFQYALLANLHTKIVVTNDNKEKYIDRNRTIQSRCLGGFYCPNTTTILPCPSGHWCPQSTVKPHKCDPLSICGEQAAYQLNFVNLLIMIILVTISVGLSSFLRTKQAKADEASRKKDPSARTILQAADPTEAASEKDISEFRKGFIEMSFQNISLQYSQTSKLILPHISGKIPAGKISALLGPTNCGKTSLLNILRVGKTDSVYSQGNVKIRVRNFIANKSWSLDYSLFHDFVGHVPQEDVFDRELTIRELFTFNALVRIHGKKKSNEIKVRVDEVLSELSIQHVADSIIGGGENQAANISGGQLKRVNIGCELVSLQRPGILLLDEPTNGLDASVAYELMETLEMVRDRGFTIVLVIQQPRAEIYAKIQHLFLMNAVGGIVYEGRSSGAAPYLTSLGYQMGNETSEADFCMDVLNGLNDTFNLETGERILDANKLHAFWDPETTTKLKEAEAEGEAGGGGGVLVDDEQASEIVLDASSTKKYDLPTDTYSNQLLNSLSRFFLLTYLNGIRLIRIRLRDRNALFLYIAINFIMAIALSVGFSILLNSSYLGVLNPPTQAEFHPFYPKSLGVINERAAMDIGFTQLLFFMSSALGTASCLTSVPVFSGKASILGREKAGGTSVFAYGIGRIIADLYFVILNAFVFAGIWCCFGHPGPYYYWIATILATAFASSGIGYISGAAIPKNSANVFAIIACFICCVFAGVEPALKQVNRFPVVNWPWYLSFATWTAEVTYFTWSSYLDDFGEVDINLQDAANRFGYDISHGLGRAVGALIALGVGMRIIAIFFLWYKTK